MEIPKLVRLGPHGAPLPDLRGTAPYTDSPAWPLGHQVRFVARLNAAINAGLKAPELTAGLAKLRADTLGGTPQDFTALIKADLAKWGPIVESLNLKTQ
jgi:hypothetical protein